MKRVVTALLAAALLLAACQAEIPENDLNILVSPSGTVTPSPEGSPSPSVGDISPTHTPESPHTFEYESVTSLKPSQPWQTAYVELLREHMTKELYNRWDEPLDEHKRREFILFDIDGDGVPELLIACDFHFQDYFAAYTFRDGSIIYLESEHFYDYSSQHVPRDNIPGIITYSMEWINVNIALMVIKGDDLVAEVRLYYRKICPDTDKPSGWHIDGGEVTETEFLFAYDRILDSWENREFINRHEITEDNIAQIIYGYMP
jgi:hypothetical protein